MQKEKVKHNYLLVVTNDNNRIICKVRYPTSANQLKRHFRKMNSFNDIRVVKIEAKK